MQHVYGWKTHRHMPSVSYSKKECPKFLPPKPKLHASSCALSTVQVHCPPSLAHEARDPLRHGECDTKQQGGGWCEVRPHQKHHADACLVGNHNRTTGGNRQTKNHVCFKLSTGFVPLTRPRNKKFLILHPILTCRAKNHLWIRLLPRIWLHHSIVKRNLHLFQVVLLILTQFSKKIRPSLWQGL